MMHLHARNTCSCCHCRQLTLSQACHPAHRPPCLQATVVPPGSTATGAVSWAMALAGLRTPTAQSFTPTAPAATGAPSAAPQTSAAGEAQGAIQHGVHNLGVCMDVALGVFSTVHLC